MSSRSARLVALAIALAAPPAAADPAGLQSALRLYRDGALSDAMAAFQRALDAGGDDRAGLATAYLHLGILKSGARDPEGAVRAFTSLLSLDPTATLPAGSSPLVREPFERAAELRGDQPALGADARVPARVRTGDAMALEVAVHGDPTALVRGVRARGARGGSATAEGAAPFRLTLPAATTATAGTLRLEIALLDGHGSLLEASEAIAIVEARAGAPPAARATRDTAPRGRDDDRDDDDEDGGGLLGSPWFWGGAAAVVAGGVVAALVLTSGDDQAHFGRVEVQR